MKITWRLPSNVPYAYAEVTFDLATDPVPDMTALAYRYAEALAEFKEQEKKAINGVPRPARKSENPVEDLLLGTNPGHEEVLDKAVEMLKDGLGATEVDGDDPKAPWNNKEKTLQDLAKVFAPKQEPASSGDDDEWDF